MKILLSTLLILLTLQSKELELTQKQANFIAKKVWQNEGAGLDKYLIHWNKGEDFASLGIGHFIWFPKGHKEKFREVFPMVLKFMEEKKVKMPYWLNSKTPFPWNSKLEFLYAKRVETIKYQELFYFLKRTFNYQAQFMAKRVSKALEEILNTIDSNNKKKIIEKRFNKILYKKDGSLDERGVYILLDYTNFKGEGTLKSERYKGKGWGLLQVLENLNENNPNKYKAFAISAKEMLLRRIKNSPPKRGEERWRKGWNKRLQTYFR